MGKIPHQESSSRRARRALVTRFSAQAQESSMVRKLAEGVTTFEEIIRVTADSE